MKPKITIRARNSNDKEDKHKAEMLQKVFDYHNEQGRFHKVVDSIVAIQVYLNRVYGDRVVVPSSMWNKILEEVVRLEIENMESK